MLALTDLDVALAAARAGGAVLDEVYGTVLAVEHKTATDGFEGEELGAVRVGVRGRTWLVDPLCGTVNFAAEAPAFCVNVALVEHGVTTTAVVVHPPTGETYWADRGGFGVLGRDRRTPVRGSSPRGTPRPMRRCCAWWPVTAQGRDLLAPSATGPRPSAECAAPGGRYCPIRVRTS